MRIQTFLARIGYISRHKADSYVQEGRIYVNHVQIRPGFRVKEGDKIQIGDWHKTVGSLEKLENFPSHDTQVLVYYKETGEICSHNPQNEYRKRDIPTIFSFLPKCPQGNWIAIGRLDIQSEGLILITNNGQLASVLMHPRQQCSRIYLCKVKPFFDELNNKTQEERSSLYACIPKLLSGVELSDGRGKFHKIEKVDRNWYRIEVREGRNRFVRRMWESVGYQAEKLIRVSYAGINVENLKKRRRKYFELSEEETQKLCKKFIK